MLKKPQVRSPLKGGKVLNQEVVLLGVGMERKTFFEGIQVGESQ